MKHNGNNEKSTKFVEDRQICAIIFKIGRFTFSFHYFSLIFITAHYFPSFRTTLRCSASILTDFHHFHNSPQFSSFPCKNLSHQGWMFFFDSNQPTPHPNISPSHRSLSKHPPRVSQKSRPRDTKLHIHKHYIRVSANNIPKLPENLAHYRHICQSSLAKLLPCRCVFVTCLHQRSTGRASSDPYRSLQEGRRPVRVRFHRCHQRRCPYRCHQRRRHRLRLRRLRRLRWPSPCWACTPSGWTWWRSPRAGARRRTGRATRTGGPASWLRSAAASFSRALGTSRNLQQHNRAGTVFFTNSSLMPNSTHKHTHARCAVMCAHFFSLLVLFTDAGKNGRGESRARAGEFRALLRVGCGESLIFALRAGRQSLTSRAGNWFQCCLFEWV